MIQPPEPPKPFHPQSKHGTGVLPAAVAYPNLAAFYGQDFPATFTTLDLFDSLAARVKELEDKANEPPSMQVWDAMARINLTAQPEQPIKPSWWKRVIFRFRGKDK